MGQCWLTRLLRLLAFFILLYSFLKKSVAFIFSTFSLMMNTNWEYIASLFFAGFYQEFVHKVFLFHTALPVFLLVWIFTSQTWMIYNLNLKSEYAQGVKQRGKKQKWVVDADLDERMSDEVYSSRVECIHRQRGNVGADRISIASI